MSNAFIQVPPQSTGLKVQTFENVVGGNTVEAEAVVLVRSSDNSEIGTSGQPLRVDVTGTTTQPISGAISFTAPQHVIADSGSTTVVTGNVTVIQGTGTNLHVVVDSAPTTTVTGTVTANAGSGTFTDQHSDVEIDYDTGAGTQNITVWGIALPASGGAVAGGTATNPIRVDPTGSTTQPVSGSISFTAPQHVIIDSGTITAVTSITNALPAGTNVIGHVIIDSGSTTAVTGNVTVVQSAGTNLHAVLDAGSAVIGHVIADSGSTTAVTGNVTVVQGTGTNLHAVLDSGSTTAVTQATAANLNATVVGTGTFTVQAQESGNWNVNQAIGVAGFEHITDGTNTATVKAASTPAVATDTALVVAISPNNSLTVGNASVGILNTPSPTSGNLVAGSDDNGTLRALSTDSMGGLVLSPQDPEANFLYMILLELRAMKAALINMQAGPGNPVTLGDFDPSNFDDSSVPN